jgi:hypothetical protein
MLAIQDPLPSVGSVYYHQQWQVLLFPSHDPQWVDFDDDANNEMNVAWAMHTAVDTPQSAPKVWYKRLNHSTWYEADINAFTQTNCDSYQVRSIRKMEEAPVGTPSVDIKWQQQTSPNGWKDIPNAISHKIEGAFLNDLPRVTIDFEMDTHLRVLDFDDLIIKRYVVLNNADGSTATHVRQIRARRIRLTAP